MTGKRFTPDNPDARAIEKFTRKLKPEIWERTLVVLTCANVCEALNPHLRRKSKEEKKLFFKKLVSDYTAVIHQTLKTTDVPAAIVEKVKVVPVGHEFEPELLDGTLWFSNFWFECFTAIPTRKGRASLARVNCHRFKSSKDVTQKRFPTAHIQAAYRSEPNKDNSWCSWYYCSVWSNRSRTGSSGIYRWSGWNSDYSSWPWCGGTSWGNSSIYWGI